MLDVDIYGKGKGKGKGGVCGVWEGGGILDGRAGVLGKVHGNSGLLGLGASLIILPLDMSNVIVLSIPVSEWI